MPTQYTQPYNIPYPESQDPVREGYMAIQGIAQAVNTAFVNSQVPPGNPAQNAVLTRLNALDGASGSPAIIARKTDAQSIATAGTDVTWNVHDKQQSITHALSATGFKCVVPGIYQVNAKVASGVGSGTLSIAIKVGSVTLPYSQNDIVSTGAAWAKIQTVLEIPLQAGEIVYVKAKQSPAAPLSPTECFFSMRYLMPL